MEFSPSNMWDLSWSFFMVKAMGFSYENERCH